MNDSVKNSYAILNLRVKFFKKNQNYTCENYCHMVKALDITILGVIYDTGHSS